MTMYEECEWQIVYFVRRRKGSERWSLGSMRKYIQTVVKMAVSDTISSMRSMSSSQTAHLERMKFSCKSLAFSELVEWYFLSFNFISFLFPSLNLVSPFYILMYFFTFSSSIFFFYYSFLLLFLKYFNLFYWSCYWHWNRT